jgi:glycosyltransferase involved in cell wall biosynthesis
VRVLLVSANFRPSVGGIERFVEVLAHGLARRGHGVTVAACRTDGGAREESDGGVRIVRLPATDVLDSRLNVPYPLPEPVTAMRTLRRLLAEADVVHPQDAIYPTSVLALALARRRVPSLLTQHVAFVPQSNEVLDAAQRAAIATLGRAARLATRVVSYNPAVARWAEETWGLDGVDVLPPGVPEAPDVDRAAVRRALGLPADRFLALFAGRDVPKKRLDLFLAARDSAYDLVAVTDRDPAAAPRGARILPFLDSERFRELLASVDAFVLPSEAEGFPLALQEALVTRLPCVVTRGPGYEHYLRDGEWIPVEADADAIREALAGLAAEPARAEELAARARAAGEREFGVPAFVAAYERAYEEVVAAAQQTPVRP